MMVVRATAGARIYMMEEGREREAVAAASAISLYARVRQPQS